MPQTVILQSPLFRKAATYLKSKKNAAAWIALCLEQIWFSSAVPTHLWEPLSQ